MWQSSNPALNNKSAFGNVYGKDMFAEKANVTTVAGPALSQILPRVAGVVAELGGSTSHLASLARERGTPIVLGVEDATSKIPEGAQVAVDGVAGMVRWLEA